MSDGGVVRVTSRIDTSRWVPGEVVFRPMDYPPQMPHYIHSRPIKASPPRRKQDWSPRDDTSPL